MKRYRRLVGWLLLYDMLLIGFLAFIKMDRKVPDHVYLQKGESYDFQFDLPAMATLYPKENPEEKLGTVDLRKTVAMHGEKQGHYEMKVQLFGFIDWKSVQVSVVDEQYVKPCGNTVGIYIKTKGVMVIDTSEVVDENGKKSSPAKGIVSEGDYIVAVNGKQVNDKEEIQRMVTESKGEIIEITLIRDQLQTKVSIQPVEQKNGEYKLGIWIRDDMQGIGTMSFMTKDSYMALGHSINDIDTGEFVDVNGGELYETSILNIIRGKSGTPGELSGAILYGQDYCIGDIEQNANCGIKGTLNENGQHYMENLIDDQWIPVAMKQEVTCGKAYIRSNLSGEMKSYEIQITKLNVASNKVSKGFEIEVTDPELLELTGGIVQGMSGSPIIQNGKLIGAVTHVFVNDPTKGYGIFGETMLEQE